MRLITLIAIPLLVPVLLLASAGCSRHQMVPTAPSRVGGGATGTNSHDILPGDDDGGGGGGPAVVPFENFGGPVFASGDPYRLNVTNAGVDPASDAIIASLKQTLPTYDRLDAYFGPGFGIPYLSVAGETPLVPIVFQWPQVPGYAPYDSLFFPIPEGAKTTAGWIGGGFAGGGDDPASDRHMILLDRVHSLLYETWATHWDAATARWRAGSGVVWDLTGDLWSQSASKPWSASSGGLAMFPGFVRYDEVTATAAIPHGFSACVPHTFDHVWPVSHNVSGPGVGPKLGTRLRLKASVDISSYPAPIQKIFQAMRTYGIIIIDDTGPTGDFSIVGTSDPRWSTLNSPGYGNGQAFINHFITKMSPDSFEVVPYQFGH